MECFGGHGMLCPYFVGYGEGMVRVAVLGMLEWVFLLLWVVEKVGNLFGNCGFVCYICIKGFGDGVWRMENVWDGDCGFVFNVYCLIVYKSVFYANEIYFE